MSTSDLSFESPRCLPQNCVAPATGNPYAKAFENAKRVHEAFTAPVERKVLNWLAERMPASINSDHLTLLGCLAQLFAGGSYALAPWNRYALLAAVLFIALNWLGDSLDGTLARFRNRQRPRYGFYVDHIIDTFGAASLMCGLAVSGLLHWQVATGMLIAFLMLSIEVYLATYTLGNFQLSYWRFGPTEIRILLAIGTLVVFHNPGIRTLGGRFALFDFGGVIAISGMMGITLFSVIRHTATLYRLQRRA